MPVPALHSTQRVLCVLALLLQCHALSASAAALEGRVVHVADGDSLTVLDEQNRQHKVRLAGIDAPERGQPFGKRAATELASLAKNKRVIVDWSKTDRYRRIIGVVWVAPGDCNICKPTVDVGLALIGDGLAWHYRAYEREQSIDGRRDYRQAEAEARARQAGLWTETDPTPPWDWRRARRTEPH
jgi:endonuclease YncB( thermonuclease family)